MAPLIVVCFTFAWQSEQWWDIKPYTQWSMEEATSILNDSPWVALSPAGVRQNDVFRRESRDVYIIDGVPSGYPTTVFYRVRLLSARPIREALLRTIALDEMFELSVNVKDISTMSLERKQQERLNRFILSNPNNPIIKALEEYIAIGINLRIGTYGSVKWIEEADGEELRNTDVSKLKDYTKLTTNTGKIVRLFEYKPPGPGGLCAQFYFHRILPDGKPLVTSADRQLLFETYMNRHHIKAKFVLKKMVYKGKLEI